MTDEKSTTDTLKDTLKTSVDAFVVDVPKGSILRLVIRARPQRDEKQGKKYTYAALYVGDGSGWYLTGLGSLLETHYGSTAAMLYAVAAKEVVSIELATEFEKVR